MPGERLVKTLKSWNWRQWLVLLAFALILGFTIQRAVHLTRDFVYWHYHQDEQIRGWMTIGYVAHSYRVPPHILYEALGLPRRPPDKRPLGRIARDQNRSMDEIRDVLMNAIVHSRPPYPPPSPPDKGTAP
jgi:hypothetical protein